jgi:hypothetical protein
MSIQGGLQAVDGHDKVEFAQQVLPAGDQVLIEGVISVVEVAGE